jgi:hypothetical protein
MTPKSEALAYRIWALCQPRGWGMTLKDCAEELGVDWRRVQSVVTKKRWWLRFKAESNQGYTKETGAAFVGSVDLADIVRSVVGNARHEAAE